MMISLFLHPLGSEALPTMERRREKRNSFALETNEGNTSIFPDPFQKISNEMLYATENVFVFAKQIVYILLSSL